jgi:hypothetical protein
MLVAHILKVKEQLVEYTSIIDAKMGVMSG